MEDSVFDRESVGEVDEAVCEDVLELANELNTNNKGISVIQMNIRSIQKNYNEFVLLLQQLLVSNADVIILTETWKVLFLPLYVIPGYTIYYNSANYNQNDGVVVFVRDYIKPTTMHTKLSQVTVSSIKFTIKDITYDIIAIYRPPSTNLEQFLQDLDNYLTNNDNNHYIQIIMGDINIDLCDYESRFSNEYLGCLLSHGFRSYINKPTRVTENSSTAIDHCFVRLPAKIKNDIKIVPRILKTYITDHYTTMVTLINDTLKLNKSIPNNTYTRIDHRKLKEIFDNTQWEIIENISDPNKATEIFLSTITMALQKSTSIGIQNNKRKIKEWMTDGLLTSIRHRDKMKRNLKRQQNDQLINAYKAYRNFVSKLIDTVKHNYYRDQLKNAKNDTAEVWKVIKRITNETHGIKYAVNQIMGKRSNLISEECEIANTFNEYFANVGLELTTDIRVCNGGVGGEVRDHVVNSLFLTPITENEVIKYINELKNKSTVGLDGISSRIIKQYHTYFLKPIAHIVNQIFITGVVPQQFKMSVIVPIYKSGNEAECGNYRPISLINNFAKIFEKCLKNRLYNFLEENHILSNQQFGFRKNCSSEKAILHLTDKIMENFNNNRKCLAIFLDLKKAFDTIPHKKLLDKLEVVGIRGIIHTIIKNYLSNRKQCTKIGNSISNEKNITIGLPQGTVLAPLLFLVYINDLLSLNISGNISSYADDTVVLVTGTDWQEIAHRTNGDLGLVGQWLDRNGLKLNVQKSKYMTFSPTSTNQPRTKLDIHINSKKCDIMDHSGYNKKEMIEEVGKLKYLGIQIDSNLKWKEHAIFLAKKIKTTIPKFYELRKILNKKTLMMVYTALIVPTLTYAILAWGGTYESNISTLNIAHKYVLKTMLQKNRMYPSESLYREANVLSVNKLYILQGLSFIHRDTHPESYLKHSYLTRAIQNECIRLPEKINRSTALHYYTYLAPKYYNQLSTDLRKLINYKSFIQQAKIYVQTHTMI